MKLPSYPYSPLQKLLAVYVGVFIVIVGFILVTILSHSSKPYEKVHYENNVYYGRVVKPCNNNLPPDVQKVFTDLTNRRIVVRREYNHFGEKYAGTMSPGYHEDIPNMTQTDSERRYALGNEDLAIGNQLQDIATKYECE